MKFFFLAVFPLFIFTGCFNAARATDVPNPNIPKVIHYVWLGSDQLPPNVRQAIQTWQHFQPEYQIKRWDEHNCNLSHNKAMRTLYHKKYYNFVSDWCRLQALQEGGIYLDTDMFLKAPLDPLLDEDLVLTMQNDTQLSASFMAVTPNHPYVMLMKKYYEHTKYSDISEAPRIWSEHFLTLFRKKKLFPQHKKNAYHIYAPNILMYDFQGGETVAEHMFASGSTQAEKSSWFDLFRAEFLSKYAFHIPSEQKYFVPKDESAGYFVPYDDSNAQKISYPFKKYFNFLQIKTKNKTTFYFCPDRRCRRLLKL